MPAAWVKVQLPPPRWANSGSSLSTVINFGLVCGANVLVAQYWERRTGGELQFVISLLFSLSVARN